MIMLQLGHGSVFVYDLLVQKNVGTDYSPSSISMGVWQNKQLSNLPEVQEVEKV